MDGCSLSMVEIAYEVRNHARYMLASPNTGWTSFGYNKLLPAINPTQFDVRGLGKEWLRIDAQVIRETSFLFPFTFALIDLSALEPLKVAVNDLADQLIKPFSYPKRKPFTMPFFTRIAMKVTITDPSARKMPTAI